MKTKLMSLAGILIFGVSLHATTTYNLDITGTGSLTDSGHLVSPFTATLGSNTVTLYCDDFNDSASTNTNYTTYVTAVNATGSTLTSYTRYGVNNAPGNTGTITGTGGGTGFAALTYPVGTQLYEEMAWLATQQMNDGSGTNGDNNDKALQEAIWHLTNDAAGPNGAAPTNAIGSGFGGTASSGDTGTAQSYLQWLEDAANDYNKTVSGYTTLNLSNWYIVTNVSSAGCTIGSSGSTGCATAGTAGTGSTTQEFLAYYNGALPTSNTGGSGTAPEPSSWILIGSGLVAAAYFGRRRQVCSNV